MSISEDEMDAKCIISSSPLLRLTDDHIADILHRLPTLADIGRAATVCSTFRRVIADHSFRRRLRATHPTPYLGFFYGGFYAAEPHQFVPYARALMRIADFSFSFIPSVGPWLLRDIRDGRVLLENSMAAREFAVADPMSQRYALLPLIPNDLVAPILRQHHLHLETFLVPMSQVEGSFRVIYMAVHKSQLVVFEFSSSNGRWSSFPFQNWSTFTNGTNIKKSWFRLCKRYCAGDSLYWRMDWKVQMDELLVLDTSTMGFSIDKVTPIRNHDECFAIVKARDGNPEMFTIQKEAYMPELFCSVRHCEAGSANIWKVMKKLPVRFPKFSNFIIVGAAERYLLLHGTQIRHVCNRQARAFHSDYFLLELDTMRLEKVCPLANVFPHVNLYTGFPPSLSLPSL